MLIALLLSGIPGWQQTLTQVVRGVVEDAESHFPIPGASVLVYRDSVFISGSATDVEGQFVLSGVPVGKVRLRVRMTGYQERVVDNLVVTSAKEVVLSLELESSAIELQVVEIRAAREGEVTNEMAPVSARQFSVEETDRYAGSRGDPARMASNFAGVQGADDSRNDIVIRGNSPQSVLWRLDGLDIPNPNHFNIPGTAGGPVSIINNKYLANSEFYTGAFPAEFGNALGGVFNLKMRNGNNQRHEFSGQLGFLGTELFAEGPLSRKSGSSYLASYRYSTVELFSILGIDIGTDAVPRYQDGAFRLYFPGTQNDGLAVWGLGGASSVDILISEQTSPDQRNIYGENDRDQYFNTRMGVVGATYHRSYSDKWYARVSVAAMADEVDSYHELVYRHTENDRYNVDSLVPLLDYTFSQYKTSAHAAVHYKASRRLSIRAGLQADQFLWNMTDSVRIIDTTAADYYGWKTRWRAEESALLLRPYLQARYKFNDRLSMTLGVHSMVFTLTKDHSWIEPRGGIVWSASPSHSFSAGFGMHSQIQQPYLYFYEPSADGQINRETGNTRSIHLVAGHEWASGKSVRIKSEVYFQRVHNVPVELVPSSFSLLNTGAGFSRFFPGKLVNTGTGENLGVEITIERFFQGGWLFLITGSVFDSKYTGSDGVRRNTDFNGTYAANVLASKEWALGERRSLTAGFKVTTAGGRWYGPADIEASERERELVYVDSLRNTLQFDPYFRFDIKLNYRVNRAKVVHEIGLDLVNILDTQNVLRLTYAPDESGNPESAIRQEYQLGFLPIFFYRLDF